MPKKYEMSFELNGNIDPRLTRTFDNLSKDVTGLEKDLGQLRRAKGLDRLTRDAGEAGGAFHELREDVREFGQVFERTLQFTGAYAIIEKITGSIGEMVSTIGELDAQAGQLGAATGATAAELEGLQDITQSMYREGLGEGVNDLTDALVIARNVTKQQGDELAETTKNAIVLQDVFRFDIPESVRTADTMMRQFGITSEQSMNLIAQGAQEGLDKSGELLDSANEYAPHFAALGYSANEMFDTFSAGLEKGAFNLDKVGDAVKEFNIRIKDGSDSTSDALAELFAPDNIDDFVSALMKNGKKSTEYMELLGSVSKETADEMVTNLKKGGKKAALTYKVISMMMGEGQAMLDGLTDGTMSGKDAMESVIRELTAIKDPLAQAQLGVALFGTQWEDLESDVVQAMGSVNSQFDMTKSTMEDMAAVKYDNLAHELKVLGRELMDEVIVPIGEDLMPVLKDMTAWAKDNKDVIKAIGLAVPAALLAKNTVGIAKDFGKVGKAVFDTTEGVSKFGRMAGLLTNPLGLAVGAVGALSIGVIAYQRHQEKARQALINMGDALDGAFDDYGDIEHQTKRTKNLIREYDRLSDKINNAETPAAQLTEARRKMALVEQELIDLNPKILNAEDAKSGKFREQLGLVDKMNQTQLAMAKRDLENKILNAEADLPKLEEEYDRLTKKAREYSRTNEEATKQHVQLLDYLNQRNAIMDNESLGTDEAIEKLQALAKEVREVTGQDFGDQLQLLDTAPQDLLDAATKSWEAFNKTNDEIAEATNSFQDLYDSQVALIELNLGAKIDEQSAKYDTLTTKEKARFDAAKAQLQELNREMAGLPIDKQINVSVVWKQMGDMTPPRIGGKQTMQAFADGGYADQPSIFGEAGPEMAIPLRKDQRSRNLHALTARLIGAEPTGSGGGDFIYNPQYVIQGNADVQAIKEMDNRNRTDFKQEFEAYKRQQQRVSLA